MDSNGRKILNTHKKFLDRSRKIVGKGYEKFFVLMLRGAETFCKILDPNEDNENLGLNSSELSELTQEQFDNLYRILISYFTIVLTGEAMPGALRDRISLTNSVVGKEYLNLILDNIDREVEGAELISQTSNNTTREIVKVLDAINPDTEQIFQSLTYLAFEFVGMQARKISESKYCFIATDIYGDYDHPRVKVFRQFRDQYLEPSFLGRIVIRIYYKLSPYLIESKVYSSILKNPIKKILDSIAKLIN